jgi:hypothetical protein
VGNSLVPVSFLLTKDQQVLLERDVGLRRAVAAQGNAKYD